MNNGGYYGKIDSGIRYLIENIAKQQLPALLPEQDDENYWKYEAIVLARRALNLDRYATSLENKTRGFRPRPRHRLGMDPADADRLRAEGWNAAYKAYDSECERIGVFPYKRVGLPFVILNPYEYPREAK